MREYKNVGAVMCPRALCVRSRWKREAALQHKDGLDHAATNVGFSASGFTLSVESEDEHTVGRGSVFR